MKNKPMVRRIGLAIALTAAWWVGPNAMGQGPITTSVTLPAIRGGKYKGLTNEQMVQKMIEAAPDKPFARPARPRKLLVFTLCTGYVHPAIPHVAACLEIMGRKTGAWEAVITDDPNVFEADRLNAFDAVVMDNTVNQSVFLTEGEQKKLKDKDKAVAERWERLKKNFSQFVRGGKGVVGFHGAADCGGMWREYVEMMGGHFRGHPWNAKVVCRVESPDNAINKAVLAGKQFVEYADEIYIFRDCEPRRTHRILMSLDLDKCAELHKDQLGRWAPDSGRPDGDNPMIWNKRHGQGRVYYTAFGGHDFELCWTTELLRHWLAGIQYALGDFAADDSPGGEASRPKLPSEAATAAIVAAAPASAPAKPARQRKVLVYTHRAESQLASSYAASAIRILGEETGAFQAVACDDPNVFVPDRLKEFDAVCLVNTANMPVPLGRGRPDATPGPAESALTKFVTDGKGLVALHAAAGAGRCWPRFAEVLGASGNWAPWPKAAIRVEAKDNPVNADFDTAEIADRILKLEDPYSREKLRVLLSVDAAKTGLYDPKVRAYYGRLDGDHALSWIKPAGAGRVYYSVFGGVSATAKNPAVLRHWLAGIQYALGDLKADDSPSGKHTAPPPPPAALLAPPPAKEKKQGHTEEKGVREKGVTPRPLPAARSRPAKSNFLSVMSVVLAFLALASWPVGGLAGEGPDPMFEKPAPVSMAELAKRSTEGVSAVEVNDYAPGHYAGALTPSPPHADMNPRKAVVVFWRDHAHRFVFSHEASYCPWIELPSGAGMCNQFFEGNLGDAELFNNPGRKEQNSFVDVIQSGPERVWVRWTYFCVNMKDDTKPRLRGTEDYFAYPNGLILRRMSYKSLMPDAVVGYSTQPVELFGVAPVGATLKDMFTADEKQQDFRVLTALDLYSQKRYDIHWGEKGKVRREGDDETLRSISQSAGCALVMPFRERLLFAVLGRASGFSPEKNQLIDHCTPGAEGGIKWGAGRWDHWPIGWANSQMSHWKPGSPYSYHFGSIGQFFVPEGQRIKSFWKDYSAFCKDMDLNRWTERRVFCVLLGAAREWDDIRRIGRSWLDKGKDCASPESIADLK
jgi:hypothetical protein